MKNRDSDKPVFRI